MEALLFPKVVASVNIYEEELGRCVMTRESGTNSGNVGRTAAGPSSSSGKLKMAIGKGCAELDLSLELSDDEAPEEVAFDTARDEALRRVKNVLDTAKREKEQLKEKRRKRQELFQEQKKRRLLPTDVLEEIDSTVPNNQGESKDEDPEEPEEENSYSRNLTETYTVTTAKEHTSFQQQTAQDFLHSRLYGPESRRTTNNELLSLQNKKGMHKQGAVQFVKKNWASKEKAKAEKLKQRWIHKQKI